MNVELKNKLKKVLREMRANDVEAVVLFKEGNDINWIGNVSLAIARAIAMKVGEDLKENHALH